MKKILFSIFMILVLLFSGCGSSLKELPNRDGYVIDNTTRLTLGSFIFTIPDYYVESTHERTFVDYHADGGDTFIKIAMTDFDGNEGDFEEQKPILRQLFTKSLSDVEFNDESFSGKFEDAVISGKVIMKFNRNTNQVCGLSIMQPETSEYNYIPDFDIIAASCIFLNSPEETSDADFYEMIDNYEEWFNKYVEVLKKYKENPTDLEIAAEATELLSEEVSMLEEFQNLDQSTMTTDELKYYLDALARIQNNLASAL